MLRTGIPLAIAPPRSMTKLVKLEHFHANRGLSVVRCFKSPNVLCMSSNLCASGTWRGSTRACRTVQCLPNIRSPCSVNNGRIVYTNGSFFNRVWSALQTHGHWSWQRRASDLTPLIMFPAYAARKRKMYWTTSRGSSSRVRPVLCILTLQDIMLSIAQELCLFA